MLNVMFHFPLATFKTLFLSLVFNNLAVILLGVFFIFILLRVHWDSWICENIVLSSLEYVWSLFLELFLFFPSWASDYIYVRLFSSAILYWGPVLLSLFIKVFFLYSSIWMVSITILSSSLIIYFASVKST